MEVEIRALSCNNTRELTEGAASSTFWELPWLPDGRPAPTVDPLFEKEMWLQQVLSRWGTCGFTAYVGAGAQGCGLKPAATALFAPARFMRGSQSVPGVHMPDQTIFLSTVHVQDAYMGLFLEHRLIETVVVEVNRRGFTSIETFARDDDAIDRFLGDQAGEPAFHSDIEEAFYAAGDGEDASPQEAYRGWEAPTPLNTGTTWLDSLSTAPMLSVDVVEETGFERIGGDDLYPLYRRDVRGSCLFQSSAKETF